jgi:hypothetical protein
MSEEPQPTAWQPFTPRGVARFATAKLSRLLLAEWIVASMVAGTVIWFCAVNFCPIVTRSIQQFSEQTKLTKGNLAGMESSFVADGKFLSLSADLEGTSEGGTADLQIKLLGDGFDVCSLFGCASLLYPNVNASLSRSVVEPWWGAWQPAILAGIGVLTIFALFVSWTLLALLYQWLARFAAYFGDRELSPKGSRRLASAAQLPAALFMGMAIILYGSQVIDLVRFLIFYALHFFIGWIYVFVSPFFLPRLPGNDALKENPFAVTAQKP